MIPSLPHRSKSMISFLFCFVLFASVTGCSKTSEEGEPKEISNEFVIDWNLLTYQIAYDHDKFYSLIGVRALSMVHLAIHDALNSVVPRYERYATSKNEPSADPIVTASQAAFEILVDIYPDRQDTISLALNKWLLKSNQDHSKEVGIELGKNIANTILALRQNDGHQKQGDYTPMSKPGDYQYTPGWDNWVLKPDFSVAMPFTLDTVTQFRSPPPPPLESEEYARSYNEVKNFGMKDSPGRTEDQTNYAHWWAEFAEHSWNRIGRIVTEKHDLAPWDAARMFALINTDIYDIYLASLESKYYYDTWRPLTAIVKGDTDGNPETIALASWEPEMLTPPWPEYPSAHAAVAAGGAEIVSHVLGTDKVTFSMESTSALDDARERTFHSLHLAAEECADSRIMNGYHFRFATEEGMKQGKKIARYIHTNFLYLLPD